MEAGRVVLIRMVSDKVLSDECENAPVAILLDHGHTIAMVRVAGARSVADRGGAYRPARTHVSALTATRISEMTRALLE